MLFEIIRNCAFNGRSARTDLWDGPKANADATLEGDLTAAWPRSGRELASADDL